MMNLSRNNTESEEMFSPYIEATKNELGAKKRGEFQSIMPYIRVNVPSPNVPVPKFESNIVKTLEN